MIFDRNEETKTVKGKLSWPQSQLSACEHGYCVTELILVLFFPRKKAVAFGIADLSLNTSRSFPRQEPRSGEKRREKGEKTSGCPQQLINLTVPIDLN